MQPIGPPMTEHRRGQHHETVEALLRAIHCSTVQLLSCSGRPSSNGLPGGGVRGLDAGRVLPENPKREVII